MSRFVRRAAPAAALAALVLLASCASGPSSSQLLTLERQERSYERFKADHALKDKGDLDVPGIYFDKNAFIVVLGLTDSGTDNAPSWACDKLLTAFYGLRIVDQTKVSAEEFAALALRFEIVGVSEGTYSDIVRVRVAERDVRRFRDGYLED